MTSEKLATATRKLGAAQRRMRKALAIYSAAYGAHRWETVMDDACRAGLPRIFRRAEQRCNGYRKALARLEKI